LSSRPLVPKRYAKGLFVGPRFWGKANLTKPNEATTGRQLLPGFGRQWCRNRRCRLAASRSIHAWEQEIGLRHERVSFKVSANAIQDTTSLRSIHAFNLVSWTHFCFLHCRSIYLWVVVYYFWYYYEIVCFVSYTKITKSGKICRFKLCIWCLWDK
jgi:hypothetical protein